MIPIEMPYGSWTSPITTEVITQESVSFCDMQSDGDLLYWTELRPYEKGRVALMKRDRAGHISEVSPDISVRTRVHEYGGGAFCAQMGVVYFSNDQDKAYYCIDSKGKLKKLCGDVSRRFADGCITPDGQSVYLVCEEHRSNGEVLNYLVQMDQEGKQQVIASGHDFYGSPRLSPDGKALAFLTWDFPNMPWDGSTLWLIDLDEGLPIEIAGGSNESICQVQWSPNGDLYFCSDRSGFWNLYRFKQEQVECLYEMEAEFGIPAWVFGRPTYAFVTHQNCEQIVCAYSEKGVDRLALLDPEKRHLKQLDLPFTLASNLCTLGDKIYFFGASPLMPSSIVALDPYTCQVDLIRRGVKALPSAEWISLPELIEYPSLNEKMGYGFFYPPKNPKCKGPIGEKPPLVVRCHGGPSARAYPALSLEVQFWTSRGFGFLDVNYGGSTGYGREYLKRLEGNWGVLDVQDALSAAHAIVEKGAADPDQLFIRGGSAGGYTVLCALAHNKTFAGGTSYFGVSDLELLYKDTHKFEARYTDRLVAPYPEGIEVIRSRSPIQQIDRLSVPLLLLQGDEDKIVPPNQSEVIYEALKARGIPVEYILFKGEGHGFRSSENIRRALESELSFYQKLLQSPNYK